MFFSQPSLPYLATLGQIYFEQLIEKGQFSSKEHGQLLIVFEIYCGGYAAT